MSYVIKVILVLILCHILDDSYGQVKGSIDYHVHVFSPDLLSNLKAQGFELYLNEFNLNYLNKDSLKINTLQKGNAEKMVLLSTSYAYKVFNDSELKVKVQNENDFLRDLVYSDRANLFGFCGINPDWDFAKEEANGCVNELKLDGVKFHFRGNFIDLNNKYTKKNIKDLLKLLSINKVPVLIHLNSTDLTEGSNHAIEFIENFLNNEDEQIIILAHNGGGGGLYKSTIDVLVEFQKYFENNECSKYKYIYFELSGTILERSYPGKIESQELSKMINLIGEERFIFGSDYPMNSSKEYAKILREELLLEPKVLERIITRNIFKKVDNE